MSRAGLTGTVARAFATVERTLREEAAKAQANGDERLAQELRHDSVRVAVNAQLIEERRSR